MDEIKKYVGKDIIVYFDKSKCVHSTNCVKGLSSVFDVKKKPWVNPDNDFSIRIAKIIDRCPNHALTYEIINKEPSLKYLLSEENLESEVFHNNIMIGKCEFNKRNNDLIIIHTEVNPKYGGLGIAKKLVNEVVSYARKNNYKIVSLCSYAKTMLNSDEQFKDVLR
jgi:uncharacterized Fe-S cluster protein YjdI